MTKRYSFKELQQMAKEQGWESLKKVAYTSPVTYDLDGFYFNYRTLVYVLTH